MLKASASKTAFLRQEKSDSYLGGVRVVDGDGLKICKMVSVFGRLHWQGDTFGYTKHLFVQWIEP